MSVNGIGAGDLTTGYTSNKTTKAETGKTFADIVNRKTSEDREPSADYMDEEK